MEWGWPRGERDPSAGSKRRDQLVGAATADHSFINPRQQVGAPDQKPAARLTATGALDFHHGRWVSAKSGEEIREHPGAEMARRHRSAARTGLGPIGAVEAKQTWREGFDAQGTPAFFSKEAAERLAEITGVERLRRLDPITLRDRLDEPVTQTHRKQLSHLGRERLRSLTELLHAARKVVA